MLWRANTQAGRGPTDEHSSHSAYQDFFRSK